MSFLSSSRTSTLRGRLRAGASHSGGGGGGCIGCLSGVVCHCSASSFLNLCWSVRIGCRSTSLRTPSMPCCSLSFSCRVLPSTCFSNCWRQSSSDSQLCTLALHQLGLLQESWKTHTAQYHFLRATYPSLTLPAMTRGQRQWEEQRKRQWEEPQWQWGAEGVASGRTVVGWQGAEGRMHGEAKRSNRFGVGGGGGDDG